MRTIILALIDIEWPPEHSFVDGMLATEVAREPDVSVRLCVPRGRITNAVPRRFRFASCLPLLHRRRGLGRLRNFWFAWRLLRYQLLRERRRGHRVVVFVRDDPIFLLVGSLLRPQADRLVFQSSFPHEHTGHVIKRTVARILYRLASRRVDSVTAVSPPGLERVRRLIPNADAAAYIPLLSDLDRTRGGGEIDTDEQSAPEPLFIYVGTHHARRRLDVVLAGIVEALESGVEARFLFVGGSTEEISALRRPKAIDEWVRRGAVEFHRKVPRRMIPQILSEADVGICLIPPLEIYRESSPTKLTEYLGAGLVVLASRGIPLQEQLIRESDGGILTDFEVQAISASIFKLVSNREELAWMKVQAREYARAKLQYSAYLSTFRKLIGNIE